MRMCRYVYFSMKIVFALAAKYTSLFVLNMKNKFIESKVLIS